MSEQWDHSTKWQRAHRVHRVEGRGDRDPKTGKILNPNNVSGVRFVGGVEDLARSGYLDPRHEQAAEDYALLARANLGSPSSQDCTASMMQGFVDGGGDVDHGPSERDRDDWRALQRQLGMIRAAELDRCLWESDQRVTTRPELLRAGLEIVADFFKR